MNIQIDTTQKTIKLSESVQLGELAEILNKLFPNNTWKEYKLETNTIINNWSNPIYIDRWVYPSYPWNPFIGTTNDFTVTSNNGSSDFTVTRNI